MRLPLMIGLLALAACQSEAPATNSATTKGEAKATAPAKAVDEESATDLLSWGLSYPAEVAAIPVLADRIRAASMEQKTENIAAATSDKAEREKNGFDFNGYEQADSYEVAGDTPRLLSIADNWYVFTGGAHPNHGTKALLWDREAGREIAFADLLSGGAGVLGPLFAAAYCAALDKQRAEKRGPEDAGAPDDMFNQCPKFAELAIIPKGAKGKPFSTILFHADPYVEGDYDVELPVTAALIAALRPDYRASFVAAR
ncbi:MAG: DUF4163 domain-containing protein [Sphingomicrobium sp.]